MVAFASNLLNNLPMGLIAATTSQAAQVPTHVTGALLIGVDLGPNLSVTGSLATILWLIALRREGEHVGAAISEARPDRDAAGAVAVAAGAFRGVVTERMANDARPGNPS